MDPMETVAEEFPDQTFLHLTGYKTNGKNFGNFFGAIEDMKYLAGMLAGSRAKADGNPKIGYMATFPIPEELRLGNAIMRGAKETCPECTMDVVFINTWHDPIKEKAGATALFDAGAQVVFTGADTGAVADVAQEKGKWGVTYDYPASCKVDACLTAPYWIWGPEYARIAEKVKARTYTAGYEYFDAEAGALGLFGFMEGETLRKGVADLPAADLQMVKDTLADDAGRAVHRRFDIVFAGPIKDNTGKAAPRRRREAPAVRPRPVPARRTRRRVHDLHVLVERGHHGRAARRSATRPAIERSRRVTSAMRAVALRIQRPPVSGRRAAGGRPGAGRRAARDRQALPRRRRQRRRRLRPRARARSTPSSARTAPGRARS